MADFFDKLREGFTKTTETVVKKSAEVVAITKCKSEISMAYDRLEKKYAEIGIFVHEAHLSGDEFDGFIGETCEKIDEIKEQIKTLGDKVAELKSKKVCPNCAKVCNSSSIFCENCGFKFYVEEGEQGEE